MTEERNDEEQEARGIPSGPDDGTARDPDNPGPGDEHHNGSGEGPSEVRPHAQAEITEEDVKNATKSKGMAALIYECGKCGSEGSAPDPRAALMWLRGIPITARCHACNEVMIIPNPAAEKAQEKRIIDNPNDPMARKIATMLGRKVRQ